LCDIFAIVIADDVVGNAIVGDRYSFLDETALFERI
jgi:hypothetical protein